MLLPKPPRAPDIRLKATETETRQELKRYLDQLDTWARDVYNAIRDLREAQNGKRT